MFVRHIHPKLGSYVWFYESYIKVVVMRTQTQESNAILDKKNN